MPEIDLNSPIPKYHQLKEIIRDMVDKNELGASQIIPPERELCEHYGVSRLTGRHAVIELVNEGLLYRVQGRGTFVAEAKVRQDTGRLTSFTQDMRERGMRASSVVLEFGEERAGPVVARMLHVGLGERIVCLRRVRNADQKPIGPRDGPPALRRREGYPRGEYGHALSLRGIEQGGRPDREGDQSYEAVLVNDSESEHLGVPVGDPALLMERVTFDAADRPFEYVKSVYRGDRYRITTELRS